MVSTRQTTRRVHAAVRPEWTIEPGELRCRVRDEGIGRVARRLAMSRAELEAIMRGRGHLCAEEVVALRTGAPVMPAVVHWRHAERSAA